MPLAPLPDEVVEFLKKPHAAVISTVRSDGAPYSAATWYDWDDGRILVNMDFERLRLSHIRRDPRVAITVLDIGDWYRAVTVLGTVVEIRDDDGLVDIDRLSVALPRSALLESGAQARHGFDRARALARALVTRTPVSRTSRRAGGLSERAREYLPVSGVRR
jgi:PPOX class probable F420-dependent enzyme